MRALAACSAIALISVIIPVDGGQPSPYAGGEIATPPAIAEQPVIRTIYNWGDDVAVVTESRWPKDASIYGLATMDVLKSRLVPFSGVACDSYFDIGYSRQLGKVLLCGRGDSAQLFQLGARGWTRLFEPLRGREFRCAVDGDRIAIVSNDSAYLMSTSANKASSRMDIAPIFHDALFKWIGDFPIAPTAVLLTGQSLFVAYDRGEYGGALYRLDVSQQAAPVKVLGDNVRFLARSPAGAIWAASGLGHLGGEHGALYRIDRPKPDVVASISGDRMDNGPPRISGKSGVEFPALTTVAGLAFGNSDRPIVVFPNLGVFELDGDRFNARYRASLFFTYRQSLGSFPISAGCNPVGVVTTTPGDLFVASRCLGVFWIHSNSQDTTLKQLIFAQTNPLRRRSRGRLPRSAPSPHSLRW